MSDGESFGQRVRRLRLSARLTQEQLGHASGLTRQAVFDVERGKTTRPTGRTIEAWARVLNVSPFYLENGYEPDTLGEKEWPIDVYLRNTTDLSEDHIRTVAQLVEGLRLVAKQQEETGHGRPYEEDGAAHSE